MPATDVGLYRTIERKIEKEGLEPARVDVIIIHGHVTLTGKLVRRVTHKELSGPEMEQFRTELKHIDGVTEVTLHVSDNHSYV